MLGWLKKKAAQQSLFNVEINTRTLIAVSNRADTKIKKTSAPDVADIQRVRDAQKSLLTDIKLALDNGASVEDVQNRVNTAKAKETLTEGAEMAIEHVLAYIKR